MDLDQIFSFLESPLESPTMDTNYASQSDTVTLQPISQPSCNTNQSLSLLQAFCSDEDTVKSYLQNSDTSNNQNDVQLSFDQPMENFDYYIENWFNFNDINNQSHGLCTIQDLTPVQNPISSHLSYDPVFVKSHIWSKINDEKFNLKSNFILLVERGYKLTVSLNTDNSEVEEPWNPDVSQKILSVCFSPLSLRSEFLSDDVQLNGFESILMTEALAAFKGKKYLNLYRDVDDKCQAKATPDTLISICNGIKGYRKLEISDKVTLLSSIYNHLNLMEAIYNYDAEIDGWGMPEFKYDRRDTFVFDQLLHDGIVHVLETFPNQLRNDIKANIIMYLIIIFSPDIPGLKQPETIRHEQYSYIYLLRRYLGQIFESDCEASDNHYRLMVKIEQIKLLDQQTQKNFLALLNEPLIETITLAVTGQYTLESCLQKALDDSYLLI